jgi:hypothetical protein
VSLMDRVDQCPLPFYVSLLLEEGETFFTLIFLVGKTEAQSKRTCPRPAYEMAEQRGRESPLC